MGRKSCEITKDRYVRVYPSLDYAGDRSGRGLRDIVGLVGRWIRGLMSKG